MNAIYVAEYRPRGATDWKSMLLLIRLELVFWVSDDRAVVEHSIEVYGYPRNEYRIAVYQRTPE